MRTLALVVLFLTTSMSVARDLEWSSHYDKAKKEAAKVQRPLLVILENPAITSARVSESIFESDKQSELIQDFELCRVDVSTEYGKRVAKAFKASTFPYTAITDKTAKYITFRHGGNMTTEQWVRTLESRRDGELIPTMPKSVESSVETSVTTALGTESSAAKQTLSVETDWTTYRSPSYCPRCQVNRTR